MAKKGSFRRAYFIERKFQTGFILKFSALVAIGSLLTGVLVYFLSQKSTTVVFEHSRALVKSTADFLLPLLLQTIVVVSIIVAASTAILTLFISHKIAGPLYRLKKELSAIAVGDLAGGFSLRKDDQLQDIASSLTTMVKGLRDRIGDLKNNWRNLKDNWEAFLSKDCPQELKQGQDIERLRNIIVQIDKDLSYFKTH
ncbi:MAG: methyl-accepting chemotaxis protein [Candidatus Omnitrophota bacterium]